MTDTHAATAAFSAAMRGAGITPPDRIIADGQLHRFKTDQDRGGIHKVSVEQPFKPF